MSLLISEKDDKIDSLTQQLKEMREEMMQQFKQAEDNSNRRHKETKDILGKIGNNVDIVEEKVKVIENVVPPVEEKGKNSTFVLVKIPGRQLPYHAIRCQQKTKKALVARYRRENRGAEVLLDIPNPNTVNLFLRVKSRLRDYLTFTRNDFMINERCRFNEREMIELQAHRQQSWYPQEHQPTG